MVNEKFIEAYWKFRTNEITSMSEIGTYLGHSNYYHKVIYKLAREYENSDEYKNSLKDYKKQYGKNLRGSISDKKCFEKTTRGRKRKKVIDNTFKKVYWEYEQYLISPAAVCSALNFSKNWFYKLAKEYEESEEYLKDIKLQTGVEKKPSRCRPLPDGFMKDSENMTSKQLSREYNIPEVICKRLILKTNKKTIWKFIIENKNEELEKKYCK